MWNSLEFVILVLICGGGGKGLQANTIDNRITGNPYVSCLPRGVSLVAETENYFQGQVYVKGSRRNSKCVKQYNSHSNSTEIELKIEAEDLVACGFNIWPKPNSKNILISGHIVVSFHPELVTSSDRAFAAHCEFESVNQLHQQADLDFNGLIEKNSQVFGQFAPPNVKMSILSGKPNILSNNSREGEVELAIEEAVEIGDPIILKWEIIEEDENSIFGIQLERCSAEAEDGRGTRIIENGCSLDDELVSDASTSPDHNKIFANSLAFKFPEHDTVQIRCALKTCVKRSEHLVLTGRSDEDLCRMSNRCEDRRNRREMEMEDVVRKDRILVSGKLKVQKSKRMAKFMSSRKTEIRFCMSENVYILGVSSIFVMYLVTISTTVLFKFGKL